MTKQEVTVAHPELVGGGQTTLHSHAGGGGGLSYTEKMQEIAASGTGWRTYDLSSYGVPANAICEFVISNSNASYEREGGVRSVGSGLERRFDLHEAEAGGRDHVALHVNVDASSQIEGYAENATDIKFVLVGYWS